MNLNATISKIIDEVISIEAGYVNNPNDSGGPTKYGITEKVARADGYMGDMRDLPLERARSILYRRYVIQPGFDRVLNLSEAVAAELVDTGVNCGTTVPGPFLQRCLNVLNYDDRLPELVVDGIIGRNTEKALSGFLAWRGKDGEKQLVKMLNCLQGERYISLAESSRKNRTFVYGWFSHRVKI